MTGAARHERRRRVGVLVLTASLGCSTTGPGGDEPAVAAGERPTPAADGANATTAPDQAAADAVDPSSVRVELRGLETDASGPLVVLTTTDGDRALPIWIGPAEAWSIALALSGTEPPRPMTHDLIVSLLAATGAEVERITVTKLEGSTYHGRIDLRVDGRRVAVDSRPSDAIAVALRVAAPLYVDRALLDEAGLEATAPPAPPSADASRGLRVQPLTPELRRAFALGDDVAGVLVAEVVSGSAAARAGVVAGDAVTAVDAQPVATGDALARSLALPGPHALSLVRAGRRLQVELRTGPESPETAPASPE